MRRRPPPIHPRRGTTRVRRPRPRPPRLGPIALRQARKVRNKRLGDACHWWAFVTITKSAGAREHYDRRRAAGDHHNAALRNLANNLIERLWWCLQHHETWNENAAWTTSISTPDPSIA